VTSYAPSWRATTKHTEPPADVVSRARATPTHDSSITASGGLGQRLTGKYQRTATAIHDDTAVVVDLAGHDPPAEVRFQLPL